MTFSLKKHPNGIHPNHGSINLLMYDTKHVCTMEEWAFASCGVNALYNMGYGGGWWTKERVDEFIKWAQANHGAGGWCAKEFYFALSSSQVDMGSLKGLLDHPKVKAIDKFYNKAHGPNHIHLFRLSCDGDFKK